MYGSLVVPSFLLTWSSSSSPGGTWINKEKKSKNIKEEKSKEKEHMGLAPPLAFSPELRHQNINKCKGPSPWILQSSLSNDEH